MKDSFKPGLAVELKFKVPENKTVPFLLTESPEFKQIPKVPASGYMVGLIEWTCIKALNPHLNWPHEQTVGIGFALDHPAATLKRILVGVKLGERAPQSRFLTAVA